MRNLTDAEIVTVAGGIERYPSSGTTGFRDGESGAQFGTWVLDMILLYQNR